MGARVMLSVSLPTNRPRRTPPTASARGGAACQVDEVEMRGRESAVEFRDAGVLRAKTSAVPASSPATRKLAMMVVRVSSSIAARLYAGPKSDVFYRDAAENVSQSRGWPESSPRLNQRTRCSELPCVNDSGTA